MADVDPAVEVSGADTAVLEDEILTLSGHMAAGMARLIVFIGEFDRREEWARTGSKSCAHWLSWKAGDSLHTAREKVRVGRALLELPTIRQAFAAGELSYSKVRAITRIATPESEADLIVMAKSSTGAACERIVAGVLKSTTTPDDRDAFEQRSVRRLSMEGGLAKIEMVMPVEMTQLVFTAIDARASQIVDEATSGSGRRRGDVMQERGGLAAIRADAVTELAESWIASTGLAAERGDIGALSLVADARALVDDGSDDHEIALAEQAVSKATAERWACDGRANVVLERSCGEFGHRHGCDVGRQSQIIPRRTRRALSRRDHQMCRFPGCGQTSWLHGHHIVPWEAGGPTDLANLVSLCGFHHRLVHEGGYEVLLADDGVSVEWADPDGTRLAVTELGGSANELASTVRRSSIDARTVQPRWDGDRMDFRYVVSVMAQGAARRGGNVPAGTPSRSGARRHRPGRSAPNPGIQPSP